MNSIPLKQQNKLVDMKVVARGDVAAAALWIRLILSTASKSEYAQVLPFPQSTFSRRRTRPHRIPWWFLWPYESTPKRSIYWFFERLTLVTLQQTDTQTDHATCVAVDRISCCAVWCDLKVTLQHLARVAGLWSTFDVGYVHFHAILIISSPKGGWSCL